MKNYFAFSLRGKDWAAPVWGYWLALVLALAALAALLRQPALAGNPLTDIAAVAFLLVALSAARAAWEIGAARDALSRLSLGGRVFGFRGSVKLYRAYSLASTLIAVATLGLARNRYLHRKRAYFTRQAELGGARFKYLGSDETLFGYHLSALLVLLGLIGLFVAARNARLAGLLQPEVLGLLFMTFLVVALYLVAVFLFLRFRSRFDLRWNEIALTWKGPFASSTLYLYGQLWLVLLTGGLYWPAALIRLYRYAAARAVLVTEGREIGRLGFEGGVAKGFGLLWGQALLSIGTLGIYLPWALARVARWLLEASYVEALPEGARDASVDRLPKPGEANLLVVVTLLATVYFDGLFTVTVGSTLTLLLGELAISLPAILWVVLRGLPFRETFRLRPIGWGVGLWSLLIGFASYPVADAIGTLLDVPLSRIGHFPGLRPATTGLQVAVYAAALVLAAPIVEEPIFRGFVLRAWSRRGPVVGIAVSSILFGISHVDLSNVVPVALSGVVLALLSIRGRSIVSSMLAHAGFNSAALLLLAVPALRRVPDPWILMAGAAALPLVVLLLVIFFRRYRPAASDLPPRDLPPLPGRAGQAAMVAAMASVIVLVDLLIRLHPSLQR